MNVILQVDGREMTFSDGELTAIVKKHHDSEIIEQATTAKLAQAPTEGQWFEVNPQAIDQSLFQNKRTDKRQEKTRELILEAFAEVKNNPEKYGKKFKTLMPKENWTAKTVANLKQLACELGDHNADWVEQALEWAQRICNGESWKAVCNNPDTAKTSRLIVWKNGYARLVGGSSYRNYIAPPSDFLDIRGSSNDWVKYTVPLVVLYTDMKITLHVDGRDMTFSEDELTAIVKKYIASNVANVAQVQGPVEGKWFAVNPYAINKDLFREKRSEDQQEYIRHKILKAFAKVYEQPVKYGSTFYTLIPEKKWASYKTVFDLKIYAKECGGEMADDVEQALEWAQRISNGESWEVLCNIYDTASHYRMVRSTELDESYERVGGSRCDDEGNMVPACFKFYSYTASNSMWNTVPLVVRRR